jgi:ABC-2 type transport system ATP-binding protein
VGKNGNKQPRKKSGEVPVLAVENVGKSFGDRSVLTGITVTVAEGEMVGIVGPNGGGKSTLLLMMAGLLRPTSGVVRIGAIEAYTLSLAATGLIGLVTARPGLYPLLSGKENLRHFGSLFGLSRCAIDEKVQFLAHSFELAADFDKRVGAMSTGMQQKLSLIRALLLSPKLLLLDEPTANCDPVVAASFHAEVRKRVDRGLACVVVTHDLAAAEAVCDRVLIINKTIRREVRFSGQRALRNGPLFEAWKEAVRHP